MRMAACLFFTLLIGAPLSPVSPIRAQNRSSDQIETVEQVLGPFSLVGQSFTVVLRNRRLRSPSHPIFQQTLVSLEIRDKSGAVLYRKTFPEEVQDGMFRQSVTASAQLLPGSSFAALLIRYVTSPAGPGHAEAWQLFHFLGGKLVLFDKPISATPGPGPFRGAIAMGANSGRPIGSGVQGDAVAFRVWTGNFYVLVPLRVDWPNNRLAPGEQCFEMIGGGLRETGCELRVQADRKPLSTDMSFVRLFREATENEYGVRHLVLSRDSKVEFLGAKALVTWSTDGDTLKVSFSDLWLKVLIDNNDENLGWIHSDEDFAAVGLPSGSAAP